MIVLCTSPEQVETSASAREIAAVSEAARLAGCRVYFIPPNLDRCETAQNALFHVPALADPMAAVWIGFIPTVDYYSAIYDAARSKNACLLNTPAQHQRAMEFEHFYPYLHGLTPESVIIHSVDDCQAAAEAIGFPVFVKGGVKSDKDLGWDACTAASLSELEAITARLLRQDKRSRGAVVVRRLIKLRHARTSAENFPAGREFRVFLHQGRMLSYGYYWDGEDDLAHLSVDEKVTVLDLAQQAARRIEVPFIAVDIGQQESGEWTVIEVNDAQFAGHGHTPLLALWHAISGIG